MGYLAEWNKSVSDRVGFTAAQKQQMMLSRETVEGLTMTGLWLCISFLVYNKAIPSYMGGLTSSSANIVQVIEIIFFIS